MSVFVIFMIALTVVIFLFTITKFEIILYKKLPKERMNYNFRFLPIPGVIFALWFILKIKGFK